MRTFDADIPVGGAVLSGTLALPESDRAPGVLLIGGTFSDLRDGDADPRHRPDVPPHGSELCRPRRRVVALGGAFRACRLTTVRPSMIEAD